MSGSAINLLDVSLFTERREHDVFKTLRDEQRIYFHPEPDGPGFHVVTRYSDVAEILQAPETFINGKGTQIRDKRAEGHGAPSIHNMDAPRHAKMRGKAIPGIKRDVLDCMAPKIRQIVHRLIDDCPDNEPFDFVAKVASPLPMLVIGELLGVPVEDRPLTVDWANTMTDIAAGEADQAKARGELFQYFRQLVGNKRVEPADDLASILANAAIDGVPLTQEELDAYFMVLTAAGNETTRFLVAGGLEQLCLQPKDLSALRAGPEGIPMAIEEMIRWVTPVMMMRRTAVADTEIAGKPVKAGEKVVVYFVSANRDERQFAAPQHFLPTRANNQHIGFGIGPHFCLGAHVARLEAKILFEELLQRKAHIELERLGRKLPSYWFSGYADLPIRWN
jgi:cytochrome P450